MTRYFHRFNRTYRRNPLIRIVATFVFLALMTRMAPLALDPATADLAVLGTAVAAILSAITALFMTALMARRPRRA